MSKKQKLGFFVLASLLMGLGPLACHPRVAVYSVIPPRLVMPNVRKVAVLPFQPNRWGGREGLVISDLVAAKMSSPEAQRLYSVVEQSQLGAGLRSQSMRRAFADDDFRNAGRQASAEAVVVGRVISYYVHRRYWRKRIVYYRKGVKYRRRVLCLTRTGNVGATLRVVQANSANVMHSITRYARFSSEGCGLNRDRVLDRFTVLQRATERLANALASPLVPEVRRMVIPIETGGRDKRLNIGVKFARKKRWRRAVELWRSVLQTNPRSHRALYNLGVAAEVAGRLKRAHRLYRRAERLVAKGWYSRAIQRVQNRLQDRRDMKMLQKPPKPLPKQQPTVNPADDPTR